MNAIWVRPAVSHLAPSAQDGGHASATPNVARFFASGAGETPSLCLASIDLMRRNWLFTALLLLVACGSSEDSSSNPPAGGAPGSSGSSGHGNSGTGGQSGGQGGAGTSGQNSGGSGAGEPGTGGAVAGGSGAGAAGAGTAGGSGSSAGAGGTVGGSGSSGSSQGGGAAGQGGSAGQGTLGGPFRYGINSGFFTAKVPDADSAALAVKAGANSMRVKLSEQHLTTWGDEIEVGDMKSYEAMGMSDLVAFLGGPIAEHSTAPTGKASWELEYYAPKNLYEPIFLPNGEVNPENYWASFVARVAKTYGPWLKTYEVWNEPDQVGGNWQATTSWDKEPPKPSDLVWWNSSIFSYIRMLRITHEVVHKYDPDAQVALGGIGYPSFLSAILRYSDEPDSGAVSSDFPQKGGAYFDVVSYHYYPVFAPGNSDIGAEGLLKAKGEMEAKLSEAKVSGKAWVVTESGAPRQSFDGKPGGESYARNYLIKLMTLGQGAGIFGIDWYLLGDGKKVGASTDPFDYMGLYLNYSDVQSKDEAQITPSGVAYATLGKLMGGALSDPEGTKALALPSGVGGGAFRTKAGKRAFVLWARDGKSEDAKANYTLSFPGSVALYAWDHSKTGASETRSPTGGEIALELTSSPLFVIEP